MRWPAALGLSVFGLNAIASPASAQVVQPCADIVDMDAIVEPWEQHTRTFSNGKVRIALVDLVEPAAGAYHLLVLSPPVDDIGARQCSLIGFDTGIGFVAVEFDAITSGYDPARGLKLSIPARFFLPEENFTNVMLVHATLNQATGEISLDSELGRE